MEQFEAQLQQLSNLEHDWEIRASAQELSKRVSDWIQENLEDFEKVKLGKSFNKKISNTFHSLKKRHVKVDSKKLTSSLTQALEIMNNECSRSVEATRTLITSNEILVKSDNNMSNFSDLLLKNSKITTKLQKKEFRERIMIVVGLLVFFSTVIYIISKRFSIIW